MRPVAVHGRWLLVPLLAAAAAGQGPAGLQAAAATRLEALEERLARLQGLLSEAAPEAGARVERARRLLRESDLKARMAAAKKLLLAGRWDESMQVTRAIRADLQRLMDALVAVPEDLGQRLEEFDLLREMSARLGTLRAQQRELAARTADPEGDPAALAEDQERLRTTAEQLAEAMASEQQPVPGAEQMAAAARAMANAAKRLQEGQRQPAGAEQQAAAERMDAAQRELDESLAAQQEDLQEALRAELRQTLATMLAEQQRVRAATAALDAELRASTADGNRSTGVAARQADRLAALAAAQRGLRDQAATLEQHLATEGSTAVMPELLRDLTGWLGLAAEQLARGSAGATVQDAQGEAESMLQALVDALQQDGGDGDGGQPGEGGGEQQDGRSLVPISAELRLVLQMQQRINERTAAVDGAPAGAGGAGADARRRLQELARSQGRARELTRRLAERVARQQAEAGGDPPAGAGSDAGTGGGR